MSNDNNETSGVSADFQAFFNSLDGSVNVRANTVELKNSGGGDSVIISGEIKNNKPTIKAERKSR